MRYATCLLLSGCLLGADPLKGADNRPGLIGDDEGIVLVSPTGDAPRYARAGTEVIVDLQAATALAVEGDDDQPVTRVRLDGVAMDFSGEVEGDAPHTYRFRRVLDGTEGSSPKAARAELVSAFDANRTSVVRSQTLFIADFIPPEAACILSPRVAGAGDAVSILITLSEPLAGGPPEVWADDGAVVTGTPERLDDQQFRVPLSVPPGTNVDRYTLRITGEDRAGNPQVGDSLCDETSRSGTFLTRAPAIDGRVTLTAVPSVLRDGRPVVREGAAITVTLPTAEPVDPLQSLVTLSGVPLAYAGDDRWTVTLDGTEGDGLKALDARLVDAAGNLTRVRSAELSSPIEVLADFTPPLVTAAVLTRAPLFAPAISDGGRTVAFTDRDPITDQPVRADLTVFASEPLDEGGTLTVSGPSAAPFDATPPSGNTLAFHRADFTALDEGAYTFEVTLTDEVGNTSDPLPLDLTLLLDRQGPADAPDVTTPDRIVLTRQPWGTTATGGVSRFWVEGGPGAVQAGAVVVARSPVGSFLGTATARSDGSFDDLRIPTDLPQVLLTQLDEAGNPSPAASVRDITWWATLGGKIPGDTVANPHRLDGVPQHTPLRDAPARAELSVVPTPGVPAITEGAGQWSNLSTTGRPLATIEAAAAVDPVRGETLLFGGYQQTPFARRDRLWSWDGRAWRDRTLASGNPPARNRAAMAWDPQRQSVLLFGGQTAAGVVGDLWRWTGTTWQALSPPGERPAPRTFAALATDEDRGQVVLFGGQTAGFASFASQLLGDTWVFDGDRWHPLHTPTSPSPRGHARMVWDPIRRELVLFGGRELSVVSDTWIFDGHTWRDATPDGPSPPARESFAMAWDPDTEQVVLMGGRDASFAALDDLWGWDGERWAPMSTDVGPTDRAQHVLTQDPQTGALLLTAGRDGSNTWDAQLWTRQGDTWQANTSTQAPPAWSGALAAWDPVRERVVLFGGFSAPTDELLEWDGRRWEHRTGLSPAPPSGSGTNHALMWDPTSSSIVLFAGTDQGSGSSAPTSVWSWDGASWSELDPDPLPVITSRMFAATTPDGIALVGSGSSGGEHWTWADGAWTDETPATSPPASEDSPVVWDAARGELLLHAWFQGIPIGLAAWDGGAWANLSPDEPRPRVIRHATLTDDPNRERVYLWGGDGGGNELWSWNGAAWTEEAPGGRRPDPRNRPTTAFDTVRGEMVLFGTTGGGGESLDLLDPGGRRRPAQIFTADWSAANAPSRSISWIEARWAGGATGFPGGQPTHGATLSVWDGSRWRPLAGHNAPASAPAPLCAVVRLPDTTPANGACEDRVDPDALGTLAVGLIRREIQLALVADAPNGTGGPHTPWGSVATEDVELVIRYRLGEP